MTTETIHVTLDEFARDLPGFFERVAHDRETVVVENPTGEQVEVRPARNGRPRRGLRTPSAEDLEAFYSSFGGWADVDVDALLRKVYESRDLPPRPRVEL